MSKRSQQGVDSGRRDGEVERDHLDRIVEMWKAERPDLDTWPLAVFGRVKRITELLEQQLAPLFAARNIKGGEFEVLSALRRSGPPYEVSPGDISRMLIVTAGAMTKRLDNLERAGLVERKPHPADRRALLVALTDEGLAVIDEVLPLVIDEVGRLLEPIRGEDGQLAGYLRKVLVRLEHA